MTFPKQNEEKYFCLFVIEFENTLNITKMQPKLLPLLKPPSILVLIKIIHKNL
jgi:hypothetical protein